MTVGELIAILSKADPEMKAFIWDCYDDEMSDQIYVTVSDYFPRHTLEVEKVVLVSSYVPFNREQQLT
jgi:hypothetical protein